MRTRITIITTATFLVFCVIVSSASAQGNCSMQTIVGTYAMFERGSSLQVNPNVPQYFPFFSGAIAPFANISEITLTADGVGSGYYWIWAGGISAMPDRIPVQITVTEMNPDCTGKFKYVANIPGGLSANIEERFIVMDNGREIRTVPTSCENCIPGVVWTGTSHRINKGSVPVNSCGPQTAHGSYVTSCENIVQLDPKTAVADVFLSRTRVSMSGDFTGELYESLGGVSIDGIPINGTISVNPDCSFSETFNVPVINASILVRGVYFDEGKEFYATPVNDPNVPPEQQGVRYSFCQGKRVSQ